MKLILPLCVGALLSVTSCSSYAKKHDIDELRTELASTRQTANQALATSQEARQLAEEANTTSRNTVEIVNRSYKTSMRK